MNKTGQIGIDIGGTHVRVGVVSEGKVLRFAHHPIGSDRSPKGVAVQCHQIAVSLLDDITPTAVGVGLPGIVDYDAQLVLKSPHYPDWINTPFKSVFSKQFKLPATIDNDANMILRGEAAFGAARDLPHAIMITLGTGIGGALLINGSLFHGHRGFAGEMGHMVIEMDGAPCPCGGRGCWELYCASRAFERLPHPVSTTEMASRAQSGDADAIRHWQRFGAYLGAGIASLANILGINHVVIGGGIAHAWELFEPAMKQEIPRRTYAEVASDLVITRWQLDNHAGILGAANCARRMGEY